MKKSEILEKFMRVYDFKHDSDVAAFLGLNYRSQPRQWANGERQEDINTAIMTKLLEKIYSLQLLSCHPRDAEP